VYASVQITCGACAKSCYAAGGSSIPRAAIALAGSKGVYAMDGLDRSGDAEKIRASNRCKGERRVCRTCKTHGGI
jgi:hypothetical protein